VIRLLLADDEDLLRGALAALLELEEDLTVVAEASTSTNAVRLAREHRPDIAVLDLEMPPGQQPAVKKSSTESRADGKVNRPASDAPAAR
jgi:DNA-binding NarL/FixJ family response regulator